MKILFTRTIEASIIEKLSQAGHEVVRIDVLTIKPLKNHEKDILKYWDSFQNLVFTSQHAVKFFFDVLNKNHKTLSNAIKIFSTSGETRTILQKYGYPPTLSAPTAHSLALLMSEKADLTQGVYFIAGTLTLPTLPQILTEKGLTIHILKVYETLKNPTPAYPLSTIDAIVFFSPSAAETFLINNTLSESCKIFTLGTTTAQFVHEKTGLKDIFVASQPTIDAITDKIIEIL